ncbi:MAG: hypothetical protein A2W03_04785 [Candidatus Aminicenantes bacterium RBG_16_63_16]|nr:MAG: hypothetical protein A2W03_04785 [Candidatus Aminicenantes bacterium RBG_16_63_16]
MPWRSRIADGAALLTLVTLPALSREPSIPPRSSTPVAIPRLTAPVTFDGLSDEAAWRDVPPLPMVMMMPNFGLPPSEKTEVRLGFDEGYLWVAACLFDREPDKIQAPSKKRDYMEPNTDWFGVVIDTFCDKENGLGFMTTPSGLRWDGAIFNDAVMSSPLQEPINLSWNTFWDVKVVTNGQGWFVEMRIPFSSLRFQQTDGRVVMGLVVWRWIARKNEQIVFPAIYPKWGFMSAWKPSQAQEICLEGVRSRNPLYIAPYALGGYAKSYDLDATESFYLRTQKPTKEAGLDVKYGLSSSFTLDVTLNPDFAQVEADDQQVNLTRFSLFYPEKRLFFQERSSTFDFNFGASSRLFYTRRMGIYLAEDEEEGEGEIARLYGGTRLVGRAGPWDIGLMDMQQASVAGTPSKNLGVLRLRRRVFNPYSYVGGMMTSVIGADGSYNTCYGLDGIFRVTGDDYLMMAWAQSFENGKENRLLSIDPARFRLAYERRTDEGLGFYAGVSRAGRAYNPGLGFEMREDFTSTRERLAYGWIPGERSWLQSHSVYAEGFFYLRNSDRTIESARFGPGWEFNAKAGWGGQLSLLGYHESLRELLEFTTEVGVPPGEYDFVGVQGEFHTAMGSLFSSMFTVDAGSFYDGWRTTLRAMPNWSILPDLTLGGTYEFNWVNFPDRGQKFIAHLVQLRLVATLSTKTSLLSYIQYNGVDDLVVANLRLRFNPREGNDLYLVYNEVLNTDRLGKIPYPPSSGGRAILLKYSYTFNF